jgi:hypothetical protein
MTTDEVRDLRRALEFELASGRIRPAHLILAAFDRACVRAATRPGRQGGPLSPARFAVRPTPVNAIAGPQTGRGVR